MNKISILFTVLLVFALSSVAIAQDELEEYDVLEIGLYGGIGQPMGGISDWKTGGDLGEQGEIVDRAPKSGKDIGVYVGYFVTPKFITGFNFSYTEFSIDADLAGDHRHRLFTPSIYGKYCFEGETNWLPYVKAHIGLENAKFSTFVENRDGRRFRELSYDPTLAYGIGAGIFYYTTFYSGLYLEADYHTAGTKDTKSEYLDDSYTFGENTGVMQINFGIRLIVGSGE
ncbi:MAG: hypothetical protein U9N55_00165 [candidate division Zixibacteria bacterium]|nr:hypothetical protein [candidate division Zixibacteria bacterium]